MDRTFLRNAEHADPARHRPSRLLYTRNEAAALLRVSPRTLSTWIQEGHIATFRFGRMLRISEDALRRFVRDHEQPPPPEAQEAAPSPKPSQQKTFSSEAQTP